MNRLCFVFIYFVLLNACSKDSSSPTSPDFFAGKVACDSTDLAHMDSIKHAQLDSLQALIDSLNQLNLESSASDSTVTAGFNIDFVFMDLFTEEQQSLFNKAASRWEEVIVGDLPDVVYEEEQVRNRSFNLGMNVVRPAMEVDDHVVLVYWHRDSYDTRICRLRDIRLQRHRRFERFTNDLHTDLQQIKIRSCN